MSENQYIFMNDALRAMINWQRDVNRPQGWYWDIYTEVPYEESRPGNKFYPRNKIGALMEFFEEAKVSGGDEDMNNFITVRYGDGDAATKEIYAISEDFTGYQLGDNLEGEEQHLDNRLFRLLLKTMDSPDFNRMSNSAYDTTHLFKNKILESLK